MTCSSTFLKYLFVVLAETCATYILMYCNVSLTAFTVGFVSYLRTQIDLLSTFVYEYKMSTGGRSARDLYLAQGGTNDSEAHAGGLICISQSKI